MPGTKPATPTRRKTAPTTAADSRTQPACRTATARAWSWSPIDDSRRVVGTAGTHLADVVLDHAGGDVAQLLVRVRGDPDQEVEARLLVEVVLRHHQADRL